MLSFSVDISFHTLPPIWRIGEGPEDKARRAVPSMQEISFTHLVNPGGSAVSVSIESTRGPWPEGLTGLMRQWSQQTSQVMNTALALPRGLLTWFQGLWRIWGVCPGWHWWKAHRRRHLPYHTPSGAADWRQNHSQSTDGWEPTHGFTHTAQAHGQQWIFNF